jgi:hypothetical protein
MKNRRTVIALSVLALACMLYGGYSFVKLRSFRNTVSVLLVTNPGKHAEIDAYRSVLQEEGVPCKVVRPAFLLSLPAVDVAKAHPAIIFPDGAAQALPDDTVLWLTAYLRNGGSAAVVFDAGVRTHRGVYRDEALFAPLTGVNYIAYNRLKSGAYARGYVEFRDEQSARSLQVPAGKTLRGNLLSGYSYGSLEYTFARATAQAGLADTDVLADAVTAAGERFPALVLRTVSAGHVFYANLPLGMLKANSDDLPLRAFLRAFLFTTVKMPHLVSSPYGKAGLVFNWHIDSSVDWNSIPYMLQNGYLRPSLPYSLHITAGDFRDTPGDGLGFDAAGRGRAFAAALLPYGAFGSHGGWAHNWFSGNIEGKKWSRKEIAEQIEKNSGTLEMISGRPVREFSAPNGVHPQPEMTQVLEQLRIAAYYYTGDSGSAPNRTFVNGRQVSDGVIAFPIMPFGAAASFKEMKGAGASEEAVQAWLTAVVDYTIRNSTVRLIYSHPYDIAQYPAALKAFLDYAEKRQDEGSLMVRPMSYFADFLLRFLETEYSFRQTAGRGLEVCAANPAGLEGIVAAIPKQYYQRPEAYIREDADFYYCPFTAGDSGTVHCHAR